MTRTATLPTSEPMKPRRGRRFRIKTRYPHLRSEGLTDRRNGGSRYQGVFRRP